MTQRLPILLTCGADFTIDDADCYSIFSQSIILGAYMIVFGLAIALLGMSFPCIPDYFRSRMVLTGTLEFQIPPQVSRYANFLFSFIGRGICKFRYLVCFWENILTNLIVYILLGGLILGTRTISYIAGGAVGIIGVGYVALEFIPSIEPPSNMREADVGWGAEQV